MSRTISDSAPLRVWKRVLLDIPQSVRGRPKPSDYRILKVKDCHLGGACHPPPLPLICCPPQAQLSVTVENDAALAALAAERSTLLAERSRLEAEVRVLYACV
jgi:hypothetical protein